MLVISLNPMSVIVSSLVKEIVKLSFIKIVLLGGHCNHQIKRDASL